MGDKRPVKKWRKTKTKGKKKQRTGLKLKTDPRYKNMLNQNRVTGNEKACKTHFGCEGRINESHKIA